MITYSYTYKVIFLVNQSYTMIILLRYCVLYVAIYICFYSVYYYLWLNYIFLNLEYYCFYCSYYYILFFVGSVGFVIFVFLLFTVSLNDFIYILHVETLIYCAKMMLICYFIAHTYLIMSKSCCTVLVLIGAPNISYFYFASLQKKPVTIYIFHQLNVHGSNAFLKLNYYFFNVYDSCICSIPSLYVIAIVLYLNMSVSL